MAQTEFPFDPDDQQDVAHYTEEGLHLLASLDQSAPPIAIVRAIGTHIEQQRLTIAQADEEAYALFILSMGYLWGEQVCREYGWEWARIGADKEEAGHAIASPNRAYLIAPLYFIKQFIDDGKRPTTVVLLFNMLAPDVLAKQAPQKAGAFASLG